MTLPLTAHTTDRWSAVFLMTLMLLVAADAHAATLQVGPGQPYARPCAALTVAKAGDTIEIDASGSYSGDVCAFSASNLTIRGVRGRPRIDAAGKAAAGKGIWVVGGNNTTIDNVEMLGAKVPDRNGAAIRLDGQHLTLRNSHLHDNENGILTNNDGVSNIEVEHCEFGRNGFGDGFSHNLYIGRVNSLVFRYNFSHDAHVGHNLKSRAQVNTISYNRFSSAVAGSSGAGEPSYEIDLPNAGTSIVMGNVIQQPAANQNAALLSYGAEGASNRGQDLYVVNNTFINDDPVRGTFVAVGSGVMVPVLIQNNLFVGVGSVSTQRNFLDRSNLTASASIFVDRTAYDLRPQAGSAAVDAATDAGKTQDGASLLATEQYQHPAGSVVRPEAGRLDIGAIESSNSSGGPIGAGVSTVQADCVFNWAETTFAGVLTPRANSVLAAGYYFRHYSIADVYVGVAIQDAHVYLLAGGQLTDAGLLTGLAAGAGCA